MPSVTRLTAIACSARPWSACRASNGSRANADADGRATRALLQQATERVSAILTLRLALALQWFCDGKSVAAIVARLGLRSRQHLWAADR